MLVQVNDLIVQGGRRHRQREQLVEVLNVVLVREHAEVMRRNELEVARVLLELGAHELDFKTLLSKKMRLLYMFPLQMRCCLWTSSSKLATEKVHQGLNTLLALEVFGEHIGWVDFSFHLP